MNKKDLENAYAQFFDKSQAGQYFVKELHRMIQSAHEDSENYPELSRDHAQRAKGMRMIVDHITSVKTKLKDKPM